MIEIFWWDWTNDIQKKNFLKEIQFQNFKKEEASLQESIDIETEINGLPLPEYYTNYCLQNNILASPKRYHFYTEVVYKRTIITTENGSTYENIDPNQREWFCTLEDKFLQLESLLSIHIDRIKILDNINNSRSLSDFFENKNRWITAYFPFRDVPEEKFVHSNGEIRIYPPKTAKEQLMDNNKFQDILEYDKFLETYTLQE
jgi:hypothetical protein